MRKPPKGQKAFAIRIEMDLVIISREASELDDDLIFETMRQQYNCGGPFLTEKWLKVKRIICEEDIPPGWGEEDGVLLWNDNDEDLPARAYIPSPLEVLAEEAE